MKSATTALAVVGVLFVSTATTHIVSAAVVDNVINSKPVKVSVQPAKEKPVVKAAAAEKPTVVEPVEPKMVTVNPGDHLTRIAEAHNSSVQRLYDANTAIENPDLIFPGQELRVPDEKEELAHREMPVASAVAQAVQAEAAASPTTSSSRSSIPSTAPAVGDGSVWDRLAACESGGNWAINTGNGYYGGLQFTLSTWQSVGGSGYPNQASREEQILRGQILQARSGWGQWPACTAKLGLY